MLEDLEDDDLFEDLALSNDNETDTNLITIETLKPTIEITNQNLYNKVIEYDSPIVINQYLFFRVAC